MSLQSWTPGRVNLIGEWIDFNGGLVLPAALPLGIDVTAQPNASAMDSVRSANFDGRATASLDSRARGHWSDYVFGALQCGRAQGWFTNGVDITINSNLPAGAGVSSSAAVTVGVLRALAPATVSSKDIALLAQQIEHEFIGVPCGIMDQMAVAEAGPGEAIALDTRMVEFERLAIPSGWRFAVLHSGVERQLAGGQYKARREACLDAARQLDVAYLCDASDLAKLPDALLPVARHVVGENARTRDAIAAMKGGDAPAFGRLMTQSHVSLRDDFAVSTPEVDALVDQALRAGAVGARITGAGFGGCIVALLTEASPRDWEARILASNGEARPICVIGELAGEADVAK